MTDQDELTRTAPRETIQTVNPATEEVLAEVPSGGHDLAAAFAYARTTGVAELGALTFAQRAALLASLAKAIHGAREELIAMAVAGTACTMYAIALIVVNGDAATVAAAFIAAFALGSWLRLAQIMRDMRRAGRAAQAGSVADVSLLVEEQRE